ncbi:hypothetical protein CYLTODRAFT_457765 [Cylindrobasidium torrendii FP15055 ss-10]|uniref:Uncharacterized protein n=1 Tax=Cylindrobasidium torrendii FP15055 ss-10 TaxID=1314674 RepID=A0A0D7B2T7_9AGAR|nr:hypothetical protein CYLTODRAFT_457765 [Cylindrobasidium torrendii FP15055 ss-10]
MRTGQFWGRDYSAGFGGCFITTIQSIGLGLAGLSRRPDLVHHSLTDRALSHAVRVSRKLARECSDNHPVHVLLLHRLGSPLWFWYSDYTMTCPSPLGPITWIAPKDQMFDAIFEDILWNWTRSAHFCHSSSFKGQHL